MNASARIQIEFGELETPLPVPVKCTMATASRLPDATWVDAGRKPNNFKKHAGSNGRSFETEQLIARIRTVLRKERI